MFEEPLVPIGAEPTAADNAALAAALLAFSKRTAPDDFSSLAGYLGQNPRSPWRGALLTDLGLEYYRCALYSQALEAWTEAWMLARNATEAKAKAVADRAVGELIAMHARLGHRSELDELLKAVEGRPLSGPATERVANARGGLAAMNAQPESSFRCGPLALRQIVLACEPEKAAEATATVYTSASTQQGFSLPQLAELSRKLGLNYQMARREAGGRYLVPAVVHWRVGHYAALVRQDGDRYLLQDPTFQNDVWATRSALDKETSGYFLVPPGKLPRRWVSVQAAEGRGIWGKGTVGGPDPGGGGAGPAPPACMGMATPSVDLLYVSLNLGDNPVGYSPPVGPPIRFKVHYNQRDASQPSNFSYSNLGPKWTLDWIAYITDNPQNPGADVQYYRMGGFVRYFSGFDPDSQKFGIQLYDRTLLTRITPDSYEMLAGDGSKLVFGAPDGSVGTSRRVFLSQIVDPFGNAATLSYDGLLRLVAVTDAIGQVTTIAYENASDELKVTKVTDPFGRFATFDYDAAGHLVKITDVLGLTSQFSYDPGTDFINALLTPYGTTRFAQSASGTTRSLETTYPDGTKDRVEFNQSSTLGIPLSLPVNQLPRGMAVYNNYISARNTYYWSRSAYAKTYPDYTKARIYHWLHTADLASASAILETTKEPLEGRVWYNYDGQTGSFVVGTNSRPTRIGRLLDDGTTQIYAYGYDAFGHLIHSVDPMGRTLGLVYDTNNIDLIEVRQVRAANNELLFRASYNSQHQPLARTGAAGQTTVYTYNARGQTLTSRDPKQETVTYGYDANGYLLSVSGPAPGATDVITGSYDAFGRLRTKTDLNGRPLTFDYDALDRLTRVTHPDGTFSQYGYDRLDMVLLRDRAGRQTLFEYDNMRQLTKRTDPLARVTHYEWCRCGDVKSLTDPLGRTTIWLTDEQGRRTAKQYGDGSQVKYVYERTTSRLRQVIDERQQAISYNYNADNTLQSIAFANAVVPTLGVSYTYDPDYERVASMTDGTGTTTYRYNPITAPPVSGAGQLAMVDGPPPNDTVTYAYDEFSWRTNRTVGGVGASASFDAVGRIVGEANALGRFSYNYDGNSTRLLSQGFPNGQTAILSYGNALQDFTIQQITHAVGSFPLSQFTYAHDVPARRIETWTQQIGTQSPLVFSFGYDAADQLVSAAVTNAGVLVNAFTYSYDPCANRLTEQVGGTSYNASYNALNQINTSSAPGSARTNEWDALNRLTAVTDGHQRTEFSYDGNSRVVGIRKLLDGVEVSRRRFVWSGFEICEERDATGATVTKRYFPQGMEVESGPTAGAYYYTRDHLGSIREVTDGTGNVRARYAYDPFGRKTRISGDVDADFGFAGMFWAAEAGLSLARYRAYDAELGRWLSRDPLREAELREGPNLYAYVRNEPVNNVDPEGLCLNTVDCTCLKDPQLCAAAGLGGAGGAGQAVNNAVNAASELEGAVVQAAEEAEEFCASSEPFQVIRAGADKVQNLIRMPDGVNLFVQGREASTWYTPGTLDRLENFEWAERWWDAMLRITRDERIELPSDMSADAFREINERFEEILNALNLGL